MIKERVARGAGWLDQRYPDWWNKIDLGTLEVSNCHMCVLGQVYTGCIPTRERNQILAQVLGRTPQQVTLDSIPGYDVLSAYYELGELAIGLGFAIGWPLRFFSPKEEYAALTDEWTRVIISRRLEAHPDIQDLRNLAMVA